MSTRYWYCFLAVCIILVDRMTKLWALTLDHEYVVNQFLSFGLAFNRGINFGLLHSSGAPLFTVINILIALVILALMVYTMYCWKQGNPILGYVLVLAGALSNYYDRIVYGGVIDFIILWLGNWSWPAFNVADAAIVVGIGLMAFGMIRK